MTPIWPLLPVQTGSQSLIFKKIISQQPQEVHSQFLTPLYRSLIVKKYLPKSDPNLTFTSCPNRKSKFNIYKNHISTTARGKFTIFALLYRSLILKKIFTKRWPQLDLYFLSKLEVEKKKYSRDNVLRNFNMVCILSDVNKIDPNLTFRSSRTPSVCQYKHQSLVRCSSYSAKHLLFLFGFFFFFFSFFFSE